MHFELMWLSYPILGLFAGFLAGLMGVGGGTILVPALAEIFAHSAIDPSQRMHLALGTSMAIIVFTALSSARAHHAKGAILWPVVASMTPGVLLGTFSNTWVAAQIPSEPLMLFFAFFLILIALQMFLGLRPQTQRPLPGKVGLFCAAWGIGGVSSLVAIGGGSLIVPFLTWCKVEVRQATGSSAALGFPIALAGALGYMVNGWGATHLPTGAAGYVYLPALVLVASTSVLIAPFGARVAHRVPVARLKKMFAGLLFLIALKMLWSLWHAAA